MSNEEVVAVFKRYLFCCDANRTCDAHCDKCYGNWTFEMMHEAAETVVKRLDKA